MSFVIVRKAAVTLTVLYFASQLHIKSFLAVWSIAVFGLALYGSLTDTLLGLPGKEPKTGFIPWYRILFFLPYYLAVALLMTASRIIVIRWGYDSVTKLTAGIYVGDYHGSFGSNIKWKSIVDVTNELPRLGSAKEYLNIQSWDGCPPSAKKIQLAVDFILKCPKPVLIHCAHGKGRSVTIASAALVAMKVCPDTDTAIQYCKELRPRSRVNRFMKASLNTWQMSFMHKSN